VYTGKARERGREEGEEKEIVRERKGVFV